jgi:DNA processing protein
MIKQVSRAELEALLFLLSTASGPPHLRPLIERYHSARAAWRVSRAKMSAERLAKAEHNVSLGLQAIEQLGVEVITLDDERYPDRLRHLDQNAPYVLFARGRLELLQRKILGVVGSRRCTEQGVENTRALIMPVVRAGAVVVSGLALGIDGAAHRAAIDAGGDTIAVLGCGIDICYPPAHRWLFERIASDGLLLSEFAPGTPALPYHFPHRNRIIALLAHAVLVVEGAADSGSLITARRALQHIHVMAVPGPIGRPTSEGCNILIREGAELVTCADHVLASMQLTPAAEAEAAEPVALDRESEALWRVLSSEGTHIDELAAQAQMPVTSVTLSLLQLELAGHVRQLPGNRFARSTR